MNSTTKTPQMDHLLVGLFNLPLSCNSHSSSYLSSLLLEEHKVRHRSLHIGLSLAAFSAALQLCRLISFLSFSDVLLQVSLDLPLFRLPSGVQVSATFWSSSFPFLSTYPMYRHLLIFMLFFLWKKWTTIFKDVFQHAYAIISLIEW